MGPGGMPSTPATPACAPRRPLAERDAGGEGGGGENGELKSLVEQLRAQLQLESDRANTKAAEAAREAEAAARELEAAKADGERALERCFSLEAELRSVREQCSAQQEELERERALRAQAEATAASLTEVRCRDLSCLSSCVPHLRAHMRA